MRRTLTILMAAALGCVHVSDQNMCDRQIDTHCIELAAAECSREFIALGRFDAEGYLECKRLRWLSMCTGGAKVARR